MIALVIGAAVSASAPATATASADTSSTRLTDAMADVRHPWPHGDSAPSDVFERRFPAPEGFVRLAAAEDSFAAWLRRLPLRPGRPVVRLHDGREKQNQSAHLAVVDLDVGKRDLQQCADAVIRLRAEYLWSRGSASEICFHLTSGAPVPWSRWHGGERPKVGQRGTVSWSQVSKPDAGHEALRRYLDFIFTYAGTASLERLDVRPVKGGQVESGDVFLQGGHPGHVVVVVDVAQNAAGERVFALAQSFMPAQDVHILDNPKNSGSIWYVWRERAALVTPEWTFQAGALRRFPEGNASCH
jgi:hypothetical protein